MISPTAQERLLDDTLRQFARRHGVKPGLGIESTQSDPGWVALWRLATAAWLVDEEVFRTTILPRLPGDTLPTPTFEAFALRPELEPVPRMPGTWCVRPDIARGQTPPEDGRSFFTDLAGLWQRRSRSAQADPAIEMHFLARTRAAKGWDLLVRLFREAEGRFDLDRCQQLLSLARPLRPSLPAQGTAGPCPGADDSWMGLSRLHQRHAARVLFSRDWYKTGRYYRRPALHQALTAHRQSRDSRWLLPLFAAGGVGKTMSLRAWTARELVPQDVAVAQIDFDFIGWQHLEYSPWLLLLPLAEQLARQVEIGSPADGERKAQSFGRIFEFRESWSPWLEPPSPDRRHESEEPPGAQSDPTARARRCRRYAADFVESLPADRAVVLIFDTTEEPYLKGGDPETAPSPGGFPRGALPSVLQLLKEICALRPGVRVVLSGRYDLFARRVADDQERLPGLQATFGADRLESLEVRGFSRAEADAYLQDCCGLQLGEDLRAAIFAKSRISPPRGDGTAHPAEADTPAALPFDLAFWAREAADNPGLSREKIQQAPGLHFAIERVVRRIPRADVQWLVRYAVVPRRLTREFLTEVLWNPLCRAVQGQAAEIDRGKQTLDTHHPQWKPDRLWAVGTPTPASLDDLWKSLSSYAAGPEEGWLEVQNGVTHTEQLRFHPRVVEPLRHLLEREEIWGELNRAAQDYFLQRAAGHNATGSAAAWGTDAAEALFHAFQRNATAGEQLWIALRRDARHRPWHVRRTLALMVLGEAGFALGEDRYPRLDFLGQRRVSPALEREAALEATRACLWNAVLTHSPVDQRRHLNEALHHLARAQVLPAPPTNAPAAGSESNLSAICHWLKLAQTSRARSQDQAVRQALNESNAPALTDGNSALWLLARGRAAEAAGFPMAWQDFDRAAEWAANSRTDELPEIAASALAAVQAGADGQLGHALRHWDRLIRGGAAGWRVASEWLGRPAEDLQWLAARHFLDSGRPDDAAEIAESLAHATLPDFPLRARLLLQQAAHLRGGAGEPWEIFAQLRKLFPPLITPLPTPDAHRDGEIALAHAQTLARQKDSGHAAELFDLARRRWKEGGHLDLAHAAAVEQAVSALECGQLREARSALATLPELAPAETHPTLPWPISRITTGLLLAGLRGTSSDTQAGAGPSSSTIPVFGRRGLIARAELEAARLAVGQPVLGELLHRLAELPNAVTRAHALWPLLLLASTPRGPLDSSEPPGRPGHREPGESASRPKPTSMWMAELRELFHPLTQPNTTPDSQLPALLPFASLQRHLGEEAKARTAVRWVLRRARELSRPWLWHQATQLAARLDLDVRALPPLPKDPSHPLWQSPLAPLLLLESAQRALRRGHPAAARRALARARQAPAFHQLRQPPHLACQREFDAELAQHDGNLAEAIECLNEAAAAWTDMENDPRAAQCLRVAARLHAKVHPPAVFSDFTAGPTHNPSEAADSAAANERQSRIIALLRRPPPLLKLERHAQTETVRALFQPGGRQVEFQTLEEGLPGLLANDGHGALSELHFQLRGANSNLMAALRQVLAGAQSQVDPSEEDFLRLHSPHPLIMALPWEALTTPGRQNRLLCRRSQPNWPPGRLVRWLQSTLVRLGASVTVDGRLGPETEAALSRFWANGNPPDNVQAILQQLVRKIPKATLPGRIAVVADDFESPLSRGVTAAYRQALASREQVGPEEPTTNLEGAAQASLVHFCGRITEGGESGETTLVTGREHLTSASLARLLDRGPAHDKPVVILDVALLPGAEPREYERHVLRRNLFAHGLFATGQVLAIIATATPEGTPSPATTRLHAQVAQLAATGAPLRQAVALYHESERAGSPFGGPSTALWAPHPDLPLRACPPLDLP